MGNRQSSARATKSRSIYSQLIGMGFGDDTIREAINKRPKNIHESIDYIMSKQSVKTEKRRINRRKRDYFEEKKITSNVYPASSNKTDDVMTTQKNKEIKRNRFVTYMENACDDDYAQFNVFEFGVSFNYWDKKAPHYIEKQYENLHEEMLNNKFLVIEEWKMNEFEATATEKYQEMYESQEQKYNSPVKPLFAKNRGTLNKLFNIDPGSKLSIDHILSVILYTDTENEQKCLKEQCRKLNKIQCICTKQLSKVKMMTGLNKIDKNNKHSVQCHECRKEIDIESEIIYHCNDTHNAMHIDGYDLCLKCADKKMISDISTRNREYHNWLRLLSEVIYLFGDKLESNQSLYHGISVKLLFNNFDVHFKTPLSTTTDRAVATRFAFGGGIILELVDGGSGNAHCIDVAAFSGYNEKEILFFGCHLRVKSIMISDDENTHFKKEIKLLNVYMSILNGYILNRPDLECDIKECEQDLIMYINNHISILQTGHAKEYKGKINDYILQLFLHCTAQKNKTLWLNLIQIRYLQNISSDLAATFIIFRDDANIYNHKVGKYLALLKKSRSLQLNISTASQHKWIIKQNDLKQLLNGNLGQRGLLSEDHWVICIDNDADKLCVFKGNMILNNGKIGFCMVIAKMPEKYQSVHVIYQLYCAQIDFNYLFPENIMSTEANSKYGFNNVGNASLFNASQLDKLTKFKWEIVIKCY